MKNFAKEIAALTENEDERKKVLEELKDKAWQSLEAREQLNNLKSLPVDVELRFWIAPKKLAAELIDDATISPSTRFPKWKFTEQQITENQYEDCLLYTSPSPRDRTRSRMPSSA